MPPNTPNRAVRIHTIQNPGTRKSGASLYPGGCRASKISGPGSNPRLSRSLLHESGVHPPPTAQLLDALLRRHRGKDWEPTALSVLPVGRRVARSLTGTVPPQGGVGGRVDVHMSRADWAEEFAAQTSGTPPHPHVLRGGAPHDSPGAMSSHMTVMPASPPIGAPTRSPGAPSFACAVRSWVVICDASLSAGPPGSSGHDGANASASALSQMDMSNQILPLRDNILPMNQTNRNETYHPRRA